VRVSLFHSNYNKFNVKRGMDVKQYFECTRTKYKVFREIFYEWNFVCYGLMVL
jgi:hypothetical protein